MYIFLLGKVYVVYLKFTFQWESYISFGNPSTLFPCTRFHSWRLLSLAIPIRSALQVSAQPLPSKKPARIRTSLPVTIIHIIHLIPYTGCLVFCIIPTLQVNVEFIKGRDYK